MLSFIMASLRWKRGSILPTSRRPERLRFRSRVARLLHEGKTPPRSLCSLPLPQRERGERLRLFLPSPFGGGVRGGVFRYTTGRFPPADVGAGGDFAGST